MEKKDTGNGNFSSLFWPVRVRAKKKDPKYGETEVIHTEKINVCVVVVHKVACWFQHLES